MDSSTSEYLSLSAAAPFIVIIISVFLKNIPRVGDYIVGRVTPLVCLALAAAWGGILRATGHFEGDAAVFAIAVITVAAAASGIHTWTAEVTGKNDPKI